MNRPLRRMAALVMAVFVVLLLNITYVQAFRAEELAARPGNSRAVLEQYDQPRGPILLDGEPIAASRETDDRLRFLRVYDPGERYAHVTGYFSFVYGASAVERAAGPVLSGTDDRLAFRRALDVLTGREQQGGSVALTLDPAAQQVAMRRLGALGEGTRGSVVALDPRTGAVLAMASRPTYDPNVLAAHDGDAVIEAWEQLIADEDQPLLNRATDRTYPPGSTFKIVTLAAALSNGYDPDSEVPGPAALDLPQTSTTLPNSDGQPCTAGSSTTTLRTALLRSCNSTFGAVGLELGADTLAEQARAFGFGEPLEVPFPAEASVVPDDLNPPQTAQSAIGQFDVRATPLQMAMVAGGIANGGEVMRPYTVDEVLGPDLSVLEQTEPEVLSRAVSSEVAAQVRDIMVGVVEEGTGSNAQISGVPVAGKTGTAQVGGDRDPHAWFVAFAPADAGQDPQVAVAVVVENGAEQPEISGNRLAAPIAREVIEAVLFR